MTTALPDAEVRQRISLTGLAETLFVEAGAGTGKTSQLVDRVVNLVLVFGVPLREVAAITFTEAAAVELRDRIRVAFEREVDSSDGERRERALAAVAETDQAAISTLHGFARRVLAEHPFDAGLPPQFDIADEIQSQLAFERWWERFVDDLHADPRRETLLERAELAKVVLERRYANQATLRDVAAILTQSWDRLDELASRPVDSLGPIDFAPFDTAVAELSAVRDSCVDRADLLYGHIDGVLAEMDAVVAITDSNHKLAVLRDQPAWGKGRGGTRAAWPCPPQDVRDQVSAVNEAMTEVIKDVADEVVRRLSILMCRQILHAAEARRVNGQLEFHDLLVFSRRLLRDSPRARQALHERFRCLLLDEFQDTDPIQIELAVMIAGAIGTEVGEWGDVPVDPGRLFFVGDPKQSIYRFRRADIELFLAARDRYSAGLVRLSTNFRTVEPIIDWVNHLFHLLMPVEKPGSQPKYEPIVAHRSASPGGDHRPVRLGGPHTEGRAGDLRHAEAADVAAVISDIRSVPERWPVFDRDLAGWRPARLPDVTLLVPTRTSLPYLRSALDAAGIPYRLDTGTLVFDTQEVRDVLAAVRAVGDAGDEVSLVAALRSPLYGCSDVDLFTYRAGGGTWNVGREPPPELGSHPVAEAMRHLHGVWRERWWLRPADVVERVVRDRRAMLAAFGDERPREVWRRLRFLVDQARAFDDSGGGSLRAFTEWVELQQSGGSRVHEPLLAETDDDAVRVMTIHGAKGLEFPITILSGMTTKPHGRRTGANVYWADGEPAIKLAKGVETDNFDPRAEIEDDMDGDEKLRLLYVAATRARDHLIVSCHHKVGGGGESYGQRIWDAFTADGHAEMWRELDLDESAAVVDGPVPAPPPAADDRQSWLADRSRLLATAARRRFTSATAIAAESAAAATVAEGQPEQLALALDDRLPPEVGVVLDETEAVADEPDLVAEADEPRAWRRGRAGTAIGRAVHATLQSIALTTDVDDPVIDGIAERESTLEALPEAADTVAAMVRSALASDAISLARRFPHHKELYVAAPVGDRVIEGYVDLLVETPEGLVVIDYKTDTVASEAEVDAKLDRYELQGAAYAVALEITTGESVVECRFVFCRPRGAIERSVADLGAARRKVLQASVHTSS